MATREENLKKINNELEQLSDEELENVAGGLRIPIYFKRTINTAKERPNYTNQNVSLQDNQNYFAK